MTLIWVVFSTAIVFSGLAVLYLVREKKCQIIVNNYDQTAKFELGEFNVSSYSENDSSYFYSDPKVSFSFGTKNEEKEFLEKITLSDKFVGVANYLMQNTLSERNYLFQSGNSYYTLHRDTLGKYVLFPTYAIFMDENESEYNQYRFVCPFNSVFDNTKFNEVKHHMTEQEFFEFYSGLTNDLVKIDYNNRVVYIKAFDIYNLKMTEDFPIKIIYNEEKIQVIFLN